MEAKGQHFPQPPSLLRPLQPLEILRSSLVTAGRDVYLAGTMLRPPNPQIESRFDKFGASKQSPFLNKSTSKVDTWLQVPIAAGISSKNPMSFSVLNESNWPQITPKTPQKEQQRPELRKNSNAELSPTLFLSAHNQPLHRSLIDPTSQTAERLSTDVPFSKLDKLFAERSFRGSCVSPKGPIPEISQHSFPWEINRRAPPASAKCRPARENVAEPLWQKLSSKQQSTGKQVKPEAQCQQKFFRTPRLQDLPEQLKEKDNSTKNSSVRQSLLFQSPHSTTKLLQVPSAESAEIFSSLPKNRKVSCGNKASDIELPFVSIHDFELGPILGDGKFGRVFLCRHLRTNTLYAVKKISRDAIHHGKFQRQLTWQIKLQSFLDHPNIARLYKHFFDAANVYLLMEYMEGGTLFDYLRRHRNGLPEQEVSHRMREICDAVAYMHDRQIAHRDIKPENIVLSNGTAKLCDFGWATLTQQRRTTYCGTFDYSSPEMLEGKEYDVAVDLWSLGVLAYELLTGKLPFYSASRKETIHNIINVSLPVMQVSEQNLNFPENTSAEARNFIEGLLRKQPRERGYAYKLLDHPFLHKYPEFML